MALEFTEDLSPFFTVGEFIEAATIAGVSVSVLFDEGYQEADDIEGTAPQVTCQTANLPAALGYGSSVAVSGKVYTIAEIQPDESGITVLILEYVSG